MARRCIACKADINHRHVNARRCQACAGEKARRPPHSLSPEQQCLARQLAGTMTRKEIAKKLGTSTASVYRYARDAGFSLKYNRYSPELVEAVIACYEEQGREGVLEQFPDVRYRYIIERRAHRPRQEKWKPEHLLTAAKMAGLVPLEIQAAVFNRPRAHAGSIRAFWVKRMGQTGSQLHGLWYHQAAALLRPGFPFIETRYAFSRRGVRRRLALWCEMPPWVHDDAPPFIHDAIGALADFQRWLYQTDDPRVEIEKILALGG